MKSLSLNVPDEQAQAFSKELATLMKKHGVEVENKEALEDMRSITERVKTFEDACEVLGEDHPLVKGYRGVANINFGLMQDIIAYRKLRIICEALNEGWKPTHDGDLTLKTEELENYCAEQFMDIWSEYLIK